MLSWFKTKVGKIKQSECQDMTTLEFSYQGNTIFVVTGVYSKDKDGHIIRLPNTTLPHYILDELKTIYRDEIIPIIA